MSLRIKTGAGVLEWLQVDKHCAAKGVLQSSVKRSKNVNELESKYAPDAFHTLKGKTIFSIHESMYFTESLRTIYQDETCRRLSKELSLYQSQQRAFPHCRNASKITLHAPTISFG
jgi:hypothetical protein